LVLLIPERHLNKKGQGLFQALPCSHRRTRLPGDIDSGVASQIGLVFALEIVMARIDVPSLSFLFRLNVALFAAMGLGLTLAFHFWIPPFF
jgi:hypothetical protein